MNKLLIFFVLGLLVAETCYAEYKCDLGDCYEYDWAGSKVSETPVADSSCCSSGGCCGNFCCTGKCYRKNNLFVKNDDFYCCGAGKAASLSLFILATCGCGFDGSHYCSADASSCSNCPSGSTCGGCKCIDSSKPVWSGSACVACTTNSDCGGYGNVCYNQACCAPSCAANTCGSNGCGGTCSCSANYNCVQGSCVCSHSGTCGAGTYYSSASCACLACGANTWYCGGCPGSTLIWNGASCVQCTANSHCAQYVPAKSPYCKASTSTCVNCLENAHCTTTTASKCDTSSNNCVPCTNNLDCSHLSATKCIGGVCKQCQSSSDCGDNKVCAPDNNCVACTDGKIKSGNDCVCPVGTYDVNGVCEECTSNNHCGLQQTCVSNDCVDLICDSGKRLVAMDHECKCNPTSYYPLWNATADKCQCVASSCGPGFSCVGGECLAVCISDNTPLGVCSQTPGNETMRCQDVGGVLQLVPNCMFCPFCSTSCNQISGQCCPSETPAFNESKGCVECNKHSDCGVGEKCENNACVACTGDCPTCSHSSGDYRPLWNGAECVECITLYDCAPNQVCGNGECSAGCGSTPLGQCSPAKQYCRANDAQLETNCYTNNQYCGYSCPAGYQCNQTNGNCEEIIIPVAKCSDGTEVNTCSTNKPYFCYDVGGTPTLMSNCGQCPPDTGFSCGTNETENISVQNDEPPALINDLAGNVSVGECVPGVMGWKKVEGRVVADCAKCNCPPGYSCGGNGKCVSLIQLDLNLAAGEKLFVTCPDGKILSGTDCVECSSNEQCGPNKNCSSGHCCPSYAPSWNGSKCTCATGGCYSIKPWACSNGNFMPDCETCGCPEGYDCRDKVCYEKPGAVMSRINIPDINPMLSMLLLVTFLLFLKKR